MTDDPSTIRELLCQMQRHLHEASCNLRAANQLAGRGYALVAAGGLVLPEHHLGDAITLAAAATERSIAITRNALDSQIMGLHEVNAANANYRRLGT